MKKKFQHDILYNLWRLFSRCKSDTGIIASCQKKLEKMLYKPVRWPETARLVAKTRIVHIRKIQDKLVSLLRTQKKPIRVCFAVIYDSVFPAESLFIQMTKDKFFSPFILIIPDTARGRINEAHQLEKSYTALKAKYGDYVRCSFSQDKKKYVDVSAEADIVCTANPYDEMTHPLYRIYYLSEKTLPIYFNYGYANGHFGYTHVAPMLSLSLVWYYYTESAFVTNIFKTAMLNEGANLVTAGYIKMDRLNEQTVYPRNRKRIIIAPHHTIMQSTRKALALSNFMRFADFFKKLPSLYPDVEFIFRPHPLLYPTLARKDVWGKEKTDKYFEDIQSLSNMIWQDGGDYFETFANSDGMIHDCGSFVSEYVYTRKPMCFMLDREESIDYNFAKNGADTLRNSYLAYSEDDIRHFIEEVIIKENDYKAEQMASVREQLMLNYPYATDFVMQHLKSCFQIC